MAFYSNTLNFPNLPSKSVPVGADLIMIADSAAGNAPKQSTITEIVTAGGGGGGGGLTWIATATASNVASVNFDNDLSATYDSYLIIVEGMQPITTGNYLYCLVGTGSGPTYQTSGYLANGTSSTTSLLQLTPGIGSTASRTSSAVYYIINVNSANDKNIYGDYDVIDNSGSENVSSTGGRWEGATVLTSIKFKMSASNVSVGTFKLYGYQN